MGGSGGGRGQRSRLLLAFVVLTWTEHDFERGEHHSSSQQRHLEQSATPHMEPSHDRVTPVLLGILASTNLPPGV